MQQRGFAAAAGADQGNLLPVIASPREEFSVREPRLTGAAAAKAGEAAHLWLEEGYVRLGLELQSDSKGELSVGMEGARA